MFPIQCDIEVSLDGERYMKTDLQLTVLDSMMKLKKLSPKYLSTKGKQKLFMEMDFEENLKKSIFEVNLIYLEFEI